CWEVVSAATSRTKFLVTDNPVTFYNAKSFPASPQCRHPNDAPLEAVGTRTIFPLSRDKLLIITHLQLVRNPWLNPLRNRVNARSFQTAMFDLRKVQTGRELNEDEVIRLNFILKMRAHRFVAASEIAWLYPEDHVSINHWTKLDDDWFLFPNLYKVP